MKFRFVYLILALLVVVTGGCGSEKKQTPEEQKKLADSLKKAQEDSMAKEMVGDNDTAAKVPNTVGVLTSKSGYSEFLELARVAKGLDVALNTEKDFTLFVPSNEAISELKDLEKLKRDADKAEKFVKNHICKPMKTLADLKDGEKLKTVDGKELKVKKEKDGSFSINGSKIVKSDLKADNGIIHELAKPLR
jgi:uncharacterized surface protein with fasciclin (FAS1) repeats